MGIKNKLNAIKVEDGDSLPEGVEFPPGFIEEVLDIIDNQMVSDLKQVIKQLDKVDKVRELRVSNLKSISSLKSNGINKFKKGDKVKAAPGSASLSLPGEVVGYAADGKVRVRGKGANGKPQINVYPEMVLELDN